MDDEVTLQRRAGKHAALAEPARLRIVDLLSIGDRSPTELQVTVGIPSNLLAHHLNVLEAEGIVVRHRSEADRRRSYVQLVPEALDGITPGDHAHARRVVFVCTGNSARSPLAAALWRRASPIPATSGGTYPRDRVHPGTVAVAHRHHLRLSAAAPRAVSDVLAPEDFVITVCDRAHEALRDVGDAHWSIPDPVRLGTDEAFEATLTSLDRRVADLALRMSTDSTGAPT